MCGLVVPNNVFVNIFNVYPWELLLFSRYAEEKSSSKMFPRETKRMQTHTT